MNDKSRKLAILSIVLALISMALATINIALKQKPKPEPHQITAKCEVDGKYYIETWIEVTPEQYIGLDIGDPYPSE